MIKVLLRQRSEYILHLLLSNSCFVLLAICRLIFCFNSSWDGLIKAPASTHCSPRPPRIKKVPLRPYVSNKNWVSGPLPNIPKPAPITVNPTAIPRYFSNEYPAAMMGARHINPIPDPVKRMVFITKWQKQISKQVDCQSKNDSKLSLIIWNKCDKQHKR